MCAITACDFLWASGHQAQGGEKLHFFFHVVRLSASR